MIRVTGEMVEAFELSGYPKPDSEILDIEAGLTAALAIVQRDCCLHPRDHAARSLPEPKSGRGARHPHYCLSCSDGTAKGPGCLNCRQTGFDQTPWPSCEGCAS